MNTEKTNYIDAQELYDEVCKSQKEKKCTDRLGELLLILHDHILLRDRFVRKQQMVKDEMKSFSIYRILKRGLYTFDPKKTAK